MVENDEKEYVSPREDDSIDEDYETEDEDQQTDAKEREDIFDRTSLSIDDWGCG